MQKYSNETALIFIPTELLLLVVHCSALSSPDNGTILTNRTEFETEACFTCKSRFQLIGETCIVCTSSGLWSANTPDCIGMF